MVAVAYPQKSDERTELSGTYDDFLALVAKNSSPGKRFSYSDGLIEIKMPTFEHESLAGLISLLISNFCLELYIDFIIWDSTTIRADFAEKGLEPDKSFSFEKRRAIYLTWPLRSSTPMAILTS